MRMGFCCVDRVRGLDVATRRKGKAYEFRRGGEVYVLDI